ncbi:hypothetical protein HDU96_002454, partial [Phlyctochytrium bullatum]
YAPDTVATFITFYTGLFIFTYAVHNRVRLVRLAAVLVYGTRGLDTAPPTPAAERRRKLQKLNKRTGEAVVEGVGAEVEKEGKDAAAGKMASEETLEVPPGEEVEGEAGSPRRAWTVGRERVRRGGRWVLDRVKKWVHNARDHPVAYFTDGEDSIHDLNTVIHYVLMNEPSSRLLVVHCYQREEDIPSGLEANCITLDHVYPNLRLDLVFVKAKWSVDIVGKIAKRIGVHRNMCIASCKWNQLEDLSRLKGVRLILL